jgi:hypothetical protein
VLNNASATRRKDKEPMYIVERKFLRTELKEDTANQCG